MEAHSSSLVIKEGNLLTMLANVFLFSLILNTISPEDGRMVQCDLCQDWFHDDCVVVPKKSVEKENTKWFCGICGKYQLC